MKITFHRQSQAGKMKVGRARTVVQKETESHKLVVPEPRMASMDVRGESHILLERQLACLGAAKAKELPGLELTTVGSTEQVCHHSVPKETGNEAPCISQTEGTSLQKCSRTTTYPDFNPHTARP